MGAAQTKGLISEGGDGIHSFAGLKPDEAANVRSKSTSNLLNIDTAARSTLRNPQQRLKSFSTVTNPFPDFIIKLGEILETKSLEEENCRGIGKITFQKYISKASKSLGDKLFEFFLREEGLIQESEECETKTLTLVAFIRQANIHMSCLSDTQQLEYYIKVFSRGDEEMSHASFSDLVSAAYEIAHFAHHDGVLSSDNLLSAICKAVMHGKEKTSRKYVFNWICQHCPRLVMWMHRYVNHTLTVGYSTIPNDVATEEEDDVTPVLEKVNESSCVKLHPALIWILSCSLPMSYIKNRSPSLTPDESIATMRDPHKFIKKLISVNTPSHWLPLFNSDEHGLSLNRFMHHTFDYHGPTLLFITTDDDSMFCLASDEEWRDSKHFYGGTDSVFFQLYPEYKIIERGAKILYFNLSSRGFPTGLHVGTDSTRRALEIDINLEYVYYKKIPFKLKALEAWGCGTIHAREKQIEYKKQVRKDVENRRKVNMTMDWKDNPDRYLLEMAGTRPDYARFEKETQNHYSLK